MTYVLDSEAFSVLARSLSTGSGPGRALQALRAAYLDDEDVVVPAVVLAELYRGGTHDQVVDACLSRFSAISVADTTRGVARDVGHLLARAGRGSADHVDATVVAVAVRLGGGVIVTGDLDDLSALADGLVGIAVESI